MKERALVYFDRKKSQTSGVFSGKESAVLAIGLNCMYLKRYFSPPGEHSAVDFLTTRRDIPKNDERDDLKKT